ncbi:putative glycoside hydrolase family 43 protein [Rosellinia necatrix]|uniref:Putative glycoside hydrolase family 43 protein n=1 Tax=Rosellinia necatrix TaxID=77044 RepID=A0A1W2TWR2_ROSNE|nr:putative glycoside hydrolase family 43 protein [Rosellinia necatrix]
MMLRRGLFGVLGLVALGGVVQGQSDNLGLANGYITINTANFNAKIVKDAQVLASLTPAGSTFDFLPYDKLSVRANNGQYHWGDITFRYRQQGSTAWVDGNSAASRKPVTAVAPAAGALAASNLGPTLAAGPLAITREWLDVAGDLGLRFTVANTGASAVELGALGFPAEFNSIFTNRAAADIQRLCSLSDPYVGLDAGYLRANPVSGAGAAVVVTPLNGTATPFEAYRNLAEPSYASTYYGSQTFEGLYEWQALTKAWAEKEWAGVTPWNAPTSRTLAPGQSAQFGLRFSLAAGGVRDLDAAVRRTGTPVAVGVPGYIVPRDAPAQLFLQSSAGVSSIASEPAGALVVKEVSAGSAYTVTPATTAWGRVRLTVTYTDGKTQTVHYHVTKTNAETLGSLGSFLTTKQWFNDSSDPFGRANSVMTYDYEAGAIVTQDPRVWIAGLSDEGGAGAFLAAMMKQSVQPSADEVAKLETFVDSVLWGTIQTSDYAVRKSVFFYDKSVLPGYPYKTGFNWGSWTSWNRAAAYSIDRAYDYVHVAAAYWSMYRVARAYPSLVKAHAWDWYLGQAYSTVMRATRSDVGYNRVGLMGETVFGEILTDLTREGKTSEASTLSTAMRSRATQWNSEAVPYGSEMAWDSTGQEGVYYWTKYFGYTSTVTKTVNSVLGYMPTVPHWGWNGNARRYWDNIYGGKLQRIERQIHHYGSGLNALVLLAAFRSDPGDWYLLQVGYGGASGPLANVNRDGFAAASFHSWPDTLRWDGYSGDYGPGFLGLALGSGTYVARHATFGLLAYGGTITSPAAGAGTVSVVTLGPVRRKVFIGPLGVLLTTDAGSIDGFSYASDGSGITLSLAQLSGGPSASSAVLWVETTSGSAKYTVSSPAAAQSRQGWAIPLSSSAVTVQLKRA